MTDTSSSGAQTATTGAPPTKRDQSISIIRHNVAWAMGVGLVPIPVVDVLGASAIQLKMLRQLSDLYGVPFDEFDAKNVVASLITGVGGFTVGSSVALSLAKIVPFVGTVLGALTVPVAFGALTQAVGTVFARHFDGGGTFADFDPVLLRAYFKEEFEKAKVALKNAIPKGAASTKQPTP